MDISPNGIPDAMRAELMQQQLLVGITPIVAERAHMGVTQTNYTRGRGSMVRNVGKRRHAICLNGIATLGVGTEKINPLGERKIGTLGKLG